MFKIEKGLDLPITGRPEPTIEDGRPVSTVALVADDWVGMKPTMAVREGDRVKLGQVLFTDKKIPGVRYTSPGAGSVRAVNRGEKRRFESVVIELEGEDAEDFGTLDPRTASREEIQEKLLASGLWTALRTRPFNRVPVPGTVPASIFLSAIDTRPLAADPEPIVAASAEDFVLGQQALKVLTDGPLFVCIGEDDKVPGADLEGVSVHRFAGPHPAGLPGTHIHLLDPVSVRRTVWFLGYQDAIAIGHLCRTGRLRTERVVSLAGPAVTRPRLLRTRLGACLDELLAGETHEGELRVISGSVLGGRTSRPPVNFLGRFHDQVTVLREGRQREFMGWAMPGFGKFSLSRTFASFWFGGGDRSFDLDTGKGGSPRAMVPIGAYEKVVPIDTEPTFLLRALIVGDTEQAQALGCLELDEEDLALCSFVCPGKYEYGPILRRNLEKIEKEG